MGSPSSKLKKYLQQGDEYGAMEIYQSSPDLRRNFDPNLSYGESHGHNTALHYAAKHGMKHLLRMFLTELGGNPNKRNALDETSLHCACTLGPQRRYASQHDRKSSCVSFILQWKGPLLQTGLNETVEFNAQDSTGNTCLHRAAEHGLLRCVQLLLAIGASVYQENRNQQTACDVATAFGHHNVARLLESTMVFADGSDTVNEADLADSSGGSVIGSDLAYSGLRPEDIQETKDRLLVETADMLDVCLLSAQALLRDNNWCRESVLERWIADPVQCCLSAGVPIPINAMHSEIISRTSSPEIIVQDNKEFFCEICMCERTDGRSLDCAHEFCIDCWQTYLTTKITEGQVSRIVCPGQDCPLLVSPDFVHALVSPQYSTSYRIFDIKAFVEQNPSIKWCPHVGCGRAVRLPTDNEKFHANISHAVDCGEGHYFCWECLGQAHAPCSCSDWRRWLYEISTIRPEELESTGQESAANSLWLVTYCKLCPNCSSPIQKSDGCNHIKCLKCKFDFCWVCLESWKKHSSATGGYFRCNRFEAVNKADQMQSALITEAKIRKQQSSELSRFMHYYTRFRNHDISRKLEEPLLINIKQKMELLASSLTSKETEDPKCTKFLEESVKELLKARRILCGSYVYGYYLEDDGYCKTIFEFMQNELEEATEKLSEILARQYLRTPKPAIVEAAKLARRKRHEFCRAVSRGFVPPESPPPPVPLIKATDRDKVKVPSIYDFNNVAEDSIGECSREGCGNLRMPVPKQGYCSSECSKIDKLPGYSVNVDENVELVIALEMSRLQMIEDTMKMKLKERDFPKFESTEDNDKDDSDTAELGLAIEMSLKDSDKDTTVENFLRSLEGKSLEIKSDVQHLTWGRTMRDFSGRRADDGRFRISEVHQNCVYPDIDPENSLRLNRSHSTGDLRYIFI
ncbi:ankyrin repeat and IBR domain-containing protein 1-like isoform X3 [Rhodnius prolixus]|uniref:ankyrin repeat and IBR domain-containing protein 1-like isoform X3 n=1 Tax=Rhodnius prolixus TaxID=13249 RepID=UPI003D189C82